MSRIINHITNKNCYKRAICIGSGETEVNVNTIEQDLAVINKPKTQVEIAAAREEANNQAKILEVPTTQEEVIGFKIAAVTNLLSQIRCKLEDVPTAQRIALFLNPAVSDYAESIVYNSGFEYDRFDKLYKILSVYIDNQKINKKIAINLANKIINLLENDGVSEEIKKGCRRAKSVQESYLKSYDNCQKHNRAKEHFELSDYSWFIFNLMNTKKIILDKEDPSAKECLQNLIIESNEWLADLSQEDRHYIQTYFEQNVDINPITKAETKEPKISIFDQKIARAIDKFNKVRKNDSEIDSKDFSTRFELFVNLVLTDQYLEFGAAKSIDPSLHVKYKNLMLADRQAIQRAFAEIYPDEFTIRKVGDPLLDLQKYQTLLDQFKIVAAERNDVKMLELSLVMYNELPTDLKKISKIEKFEDFAWALNLVNWISAYYEKNFKSINFQTLPYTYILESIQELMSSGEFVDNFSVEIDELYKKIIGSEYQTREEIKIAAEISKNQENQNILRVFIQSQFPNLQDNICEVLIDDLLHNEKYSKLARSIYSVSKTPNPSRNSIKKITRELDQWLDIHLTKIVPNTLHPDINNVFPITDKSQLAFEIENPEVQIEDSSSAIDVQPMPWQTPKDLLNQRLEEIEDEDIFNNALEVEEYMGFLALELSQFTEVTDAKFKLALILLMYSGDLKNIAETEYVQRQRELIILFNRASREINKNPTWRQSIRGRYLMALGIDPFGNPSQESLYIAQEFQDGGFTNYNSKDGNQRQKKYKSKPQVQLEGGDSLETTPIAEGQSTHQDYLKSIIEHIVKNKIIADQIILEDGTSIFVANELALILRIGGKLEIMYKTAETLSDMKTFVELFKENQKYKDEAMRQNLQEFCFRNQIKMTSVEHRGEWLEKQEILIQCPSSYIGWNVNQVRDYPIEDVGELLGYFDIMELSALCNTVFTYDKYSKLNFDLQESEKKSEIIKAKFYEFYDVITFKHQIDANASSKLGIGKTIANTIGSTLSRDIEFVKNPMVQDYIDCSIALFDFVLKLHYFIETNKNYYDELPSEVKKKINVYLGQFKSLSKFKSERIIYQKISKRTLLSAQHIVLGLINS